MFNYLVTILQGLYVERVEKNSSKDKVGNDDGTSFFLRIQAHGDFPIGMNTSLKFNASWCQGYSSL